MNETVNLSIQKKKEQKSNREIRKIFIKIKAEINELERRKIPESINLKAGSLAGGGGKE